MEIYIENKDLDGFLFQFYISKNMKNHRLRIYNSFLEWVLELEKSKNISQIKISSSTFEVRVISWEDKIHQDIEYLRD